MTETKQEVIVDDGTFGVRELLADNAKLKWLWDELQNHRTVFNDFTRHDADNFVRAVMNHMSMWFEVFRLDDDSVVGLMMIDELENIVDASGHLIFFDVKPMEKAPLIRKMLVHCFETLPLQRLSVDIPEIHWRTGKLLKKLGFTEEGRKRQALLMGGRPVDTLMYGITRQEVVQ